MSADDGAPSGATTLAHGLGFLEGPTLLRTGGVLVVSLDQQCLYVIDEQGTTTVAGSDAAPNGATEGPDGVVYVAAFSGAWPARDDCSGRAGIYAWSDGRELELLTDAPAAPNDLCFGPDGLLYVTDPVRGASSGRLWVIDVRTGASRVLGELNWYPNGIGFGEDDALWVADTYGRRLLRVKTSGSRQGTASEAFLLRDGRPDGFAFDADGHIVVAAHGPLEQPSSSVQVWTTDGELADVLFDDASATYCTNVAIADDGTIFVTDAKHGRLLRLEARLRSGLPLHPFRSTRG